MDARHAHAGLQVLSAKTDRNDAAGIARLVRIGWFRQVRLKAESSHVVRAELAARTLLVRMRCDLGNRIRGVPKIFGLVVGKAPSRLAERAAEIAGRRAGGEAGARQPGAGPARHAGEHRRAHRGA